MKNFDHVHVSEDSSAESTSLSASATSSQSEPTSTSTSTTSSAQPSTTSSSSSPSATSSSQVIVIKESILEPLAMPTRFPPAKRDNDNEASPARSPASDHHARYKNSPFGLKGHYLTMPDNKAIPSATSYVQGPTDDEDDDLGGQIGGKDNRRGRFGDSESEFCNEDLVTASNHAIPAGDLSIITSSSPSLSPESPTNSFSGEPTTRWQAAHRHQQHRYRKRKGNMISPNSQSQSNKSPSLNQHQRRISPSSCHDCPPNVASQFSPAGDAGLDAKKCNAKVASNCYVPSSVSGVADNFRNPDGAQAGDEQLRANLQRPQPAQESSGLLVRFSSIMYATFLVILGCILHVSELRQKSKNSSDHIYTTIVALIGIFWLLFLQTDLQRYKKYASKYILIETIFNDHRHQQRQLQLQQKFKSAGQNQDLMQDPTARSTTSSSASLVHDRMSMNTEVIFKKTAYKMYQRRAELEREQRSSRLKLHGNRLHEFNGNRLNKALHDNASSLNGMPTVSSGPNSRASEAPLDQHENLVPAYKFLHGKMGANFYLKCGMAAFCFGHVIHEGLRFGQQLYFFGDGNVHCRDSAALIAHLVTPLYSFYQLFMMFKYSNLVINRHKVLARFGLMHIIGTSVTFWFRTILEEAFEDFVHKMDYFKTNKPQLNSHLAMTKTNSNDSTMFSLLASFSNAIKTQASERSDWSTYAGPEQQLHQTANQNITQSLLTLMSSPLAATITPQMVRHLPESYACAQNTLLTTKSMNALPYLYPFTIEYNLLLAATFLSLYFNIGKIGLPSANGSNNIKCKPFYANNYYTNFNYFSNNNSGNNKTNQLINYKPSSVAMSLDGSHSKVEAGDLYSPFKTTSIVTTSTTPMREYQDNYNQHAHEKEMGEYKSNFVVNADCHSANKGLFCGFFVLLVTLVTIVIFFVTINKPTHIQLGIKINLIQEATLTALILIVTLAGFKQVVKLNRNPHLKDKVTTDDVLMLIPLPFFFINSLLSFRAETASMSSSSASMSFYSPATIQLQPGNSNNNHRVQDSITTSSRNIQSLMLSKNDNTQLDNSSRTRMNNSIDIVQSSINNNLLFRSNGTNGRFTENFMSNAHNSGGGGTSNRNDNNRNNNSINNNRGDNRNVSGGGEGGGDSSKIDNTNYNNNENSSQIDHFNLITIALNIIVMIEVLVQTNFIIDGMRRCSESRYLRFKKPGRELITFAIILNITYWIVATFETKSVEQYKTEIEYYGPLPYMFISHTTLPVMLFYRYHSSVCLAEIWNRAYKPPKKR